MTSAHARMLLLGNPTSLAGYFYDAFHKRRSLWKTVHISAFDTPNLIAAAASATAELTHPMLVTPKWVTEAEVNFGRESPMYQIRVLGDFPSEADDTLTIAPPRPPFESAIARHERPVSAS